MDHTHLSANLSTKDVAGSEAGTLTGETIGALLDLLPRLGRALKSHMGGSLTPQQMHLLLAVCDLSRLHEEGAQPGELSRRCLLSSPAITAAVDDLVEQGLCVRTHSEKDRRKVLVRLTPQGQLALGEARAAATSALAGLLVGWDEARMREFLAMLRELDQSVAATLDPVHG
jgi:DNA-binding MarR family transcriptional regulator